VPSITFSERLVSKNNIFLGQITVSDKSNEITVIPQLLAALDIQRATITTDAMDVNSR